MLLEILGPNTHVTASVFPDEVRSDKRFDMFQEYHFIEIPPGKDIGKAIEEYKGKKTADAFIGHPELLYKPFPRSQKMLALQYIIHIVGDVHQPLHVGNGFDRGANLCTVKWTDPENGHTFSTNLHSVWDDKVFDYAKKGFKDKPCQTSPDNKKITFYDYREVAACALNEYTQLNKEEKARLNELSKEPREKWYEESRALHKEVYYDNPPVGSPKERLYCKIAEGKEVVNGAFDPEKIPTLDKEYGEKAYKIAKQRLLLGGMRLAHYLNEAAENDPKLKVTSPDPLPNLLNSVTPEKMDTHKREPQKTNH